MSTTDHYIQIRIENLERGEADIIIAQLGDEGFDGFEETTPTSLLAYISEQLYTQLDWENIQQPHWKCTVEKLAPKNWNAEWEANFQPVEVPGFCMVRAAFHPPAVNMPYEIIITPKMSFGTGHHATTYMMMQAMQPLDFTNKKVFDFGTGTGILAILAEKLGADKTVAIDNDFWCIENSVENIAVNNCSKIEISQADTVPVGAKFDIILANINKNVLLNTIPQQKDLLSVNGILIMSGLLKGDEEVIVNMAKNNQLNLVKRWERDNWIALQFEKC
jgi:ribosomal protein L11 methyltransferase